MPINGFTVGKDVNIDVMTSAGAFTISNITAFHPRAKYTSVKSKSLDGIVRHVDIPDGWDFTLEVDRADGNTDTFFANQEQAYFNGQPIQSATINETITNPDGSVSQYQYTQVTLRFDDAGQRNADALVKMTISGSATRRNKLS